MFEFVKQLLLDKLPVNYYYHNFAHAQYVLKKVTEIGRQENCSKNDLSLLKTAALWHDVGFINKNIGHEEEGCLIVKKYLPDYSYTNSEIEIICGLIMATKIPQSPNTKLEQIIADADLAYLGFRGAHSKAKLLFKEMQSLNPTLSEEEFIDIQISFLQNHNYFTAYCQNKTTLGKLEYLKSLMNKIPSYKLALK
ncbi:MAG: HD domain-containing protein [Saprospiraceae bacterium]|nr:HD domain-containing protein [Candidatus Defluviibacterium haderslevense]